MQSEVEIIRNFCPKCLEHTTFQVPFACDICGSTDLIPTPKEYLLPEEMTHKGIDFSRIKIRPTTEQISNKESNLSNIPQQTNLSKLDEDFAFITGPAGSGKTTTIKLKALEDPSYMELCSTTGIAAINLGGRTINSVLRYFNTKSLENNFRDQKLHWALRKIRATGKRVLGIEECSMLDANQLDLIVNAIDDINCDKTGRQKLGLHLIGDLCQLPPIKAPFVFKSGYWDRFANNTIKLDKIWRQDNPDFITAINHIRAGNGPEGIKGLQECGVSFTEEVDPDFDGTTLIPNNIDVDKFNTKRLNAIDAPLIRSQVKKAGRQLSEWEKLIPFELRLKIGAYVMILSNDIPEFNYVNGDCGWIESYDKDKDAFIIKLKRTGTMVNIKRITRPNLTDRHPDPSMFTSTFSPRNDPITGDWIIGTISYHPLRLAYASTIHKSQGLSLDRVQIDARPQFFGEPAMGYVSISRARTPEGLVLVGKPEYIGRKISMDKEVAKYV